jgi:hypothetical protein
MFVAAVMSRWLALKVSWPIRCGQPFVDDRGPMTKGIDHRGLIEERGQVRTVLDQSAILD